MPRARPSLPRFCDPEEFSQDPRKTNHGSTLYVRCLDCGGPAWFDLSKRVGQCYTCSTIHKLHKHYKHWSDDAILDACDLRLPDYYMPGTRAPEIIHPIPLSSRALAYIASRGITPQTLTLFPFLHEVEHWGKRWLCWQNVAGSYELRELFGKERAMPRGSTKTYSRFVRRPGTHVVLGEGLFSDRWFFPTLIGSCETDRLVVSCGSRSPFPQESPRCIWFVISSIG